MFVKKTALFYILDPVEKKLEDDVSSLLCVKRIIPTPQILDNHPILCYNNRSGLFGYGLEHTNEKRKFSAKHSLCA